MSCRFTIVSVLAILGLVASGCGDDDGAPVRTDAGVPRADSGVRPDGMVPMTDSGGMPTDSGIVPRVDGMVPPVDAGPRRDSGMVVPTDGGGTVPGGTGAACMMDSDCSMLGMGAMCLTDLGGFYTFPGGYCTTTCMAAGDCAGGGECLMIPLAGGYCVKSCTSSAQCREAEGYTCQMPPIGGMGGMYCLPPMMTPMP